METKMFKKGQKIAVAVSGGIDSMVLLHKLLSVKDSLGIEVAAVNIDHGIRENSKEDSLFVKGICKEWKVDFLGIVVDVPTFASQNKLSTETAARLLRYKALENLNADYVALAHHMSDQAETVLMHLVRGSGTKGMAGMSLVNGKYIRPLLDVSKAHIEEYQKTFNIPFVVDQSNFECDKTRNLVRNKIFPLLGEVNGNVVQNICRAAKNFEEDDRFFDKLVTTQNLSLGAEQSSIPLQVFNRGKAMWSRCVFECAQALGVYFDIESRHINLVGRLAKKGQNGSSLDFPYGIVVTRQYDCIVFSKGQEHEKAEEEVLFCVGSMQIGGNAIEVRQATEYDKLYFDMDKVPDEAVLRTRRDGDVFQKFGSGSKKLKDFLIDKKIPQRQRDHLVVLAEGNEVLFVVGVEISQKISVDQNTTNIFTITTKGESL